MTVTMPVILGITAIFGLGLGLMIYERFIGRVIRFQTRQRVRRLFSDNDSFHLTTNQSKMSVWSTLGLALSPANLEELAKTREKLHFAGYRQEEHVGRFYIFKYGGVLFGLLSGLYLWHLGLFTPQMTIIFAIAFLFVPDIALKIITHNRLQKVTMALPDFIDLCNVSMTAGLSWLISVKRVIRELKPIHPEICREFAHLFNQIQTGMDRIEAFEHLAQRNPTAEMQYLVNVLIQNERMGSSILTSLNDFSQRIYRMREQTMEEKAGKLSAKMAFIILPFFLLPFMLIIVSEQIVNLMRMLTS
ncbi:MAG TPA: type II secretion system protein [Desulfobacterales bacterium]|nr:type II secretion system protein [Desulfobacterales bacterium]